MSFRGWTAGLAAGLLLLLAGCLPIPQVRLELELPPVTYRGSPLTVQTEYFSVRGYPEPHTPRSYNQSYVLRYYRPEDQLDTVLILMPGIFGGASSFDILARQLVASTPGLEVWAIDRRANALEDREVMVASLRARDPMLAYRYYVENAGTPDGFNPLAPDDLRFMAYWGLEVHLRDLHEVVLLARERASRVVLGGHSLGGSLVGFYAAYQDRLVQPGYRYLDGLLLIEGVLGRTGGYALDPALTTSLELLPDIEGLESGEDPPYLTLGFTPSLQARREVMAQLARFTPEALSPGGYLPYPATNLAVLGILEGDRYAPTQIFGSSLGEAVGAEVSGNLTAVLLGGVQSASSQSVVGPAPGYEVVDWHRTPVAHTDPAALARAWSTPESNRSEWYFPLRLALEIGEQDIRLERGDAFIPNAQVSTPTLAVGAERGLVQSLDTFASYQNARPGSLFSSYILPGFSHMDIIQAEENPLVALIKLWLEQLT